MRNQGQGKLVVTLVVIMVVFIGVNRLCPSLQAATLTYDRYHIVQKGDTLWDIASGYAETAEGILRLAKEIKQRNNLRTDVIRPRQKLIIPIKIEGVYHVVKQYEYLWRICKTYGVDFDQVVRFNRISDPNRIVPGQKLFIPGARSVKGVDIPEELIAGQTPDSPPVPPEKDTAQPSSQKAVKGKGSLIWPIQDTIQAYRKSSFGIDILAPEGATIIAAAKGRIEFVGVVRKYGDRIMKAILIEHPELGLYTLCYTHSLLPLVVKDDLVEKGEPIARLVSAELGAETVLYFEVRRKDTKPIDPLEYLPPDFE